MQRLNKHQESGRANEKSRVALSSRVSLRVAYLLLLAVTLILSSCGGSSSSTSSQQNGAIPGNWQFSMTPADPNYPASAQYGLQGGFLLQTNGKISGQVVYTIASDQLQNGLPVICDSGSAFVTGTVSGQNVTLSAVAGSQTFSLTGTLGSNGSITNGQFTTPGGMVAGAVCGAPAPQGGSQVWSAVPVPVLSGSVTGSFHSTGLNLNNQEFQVTGTLNQGQNIGASRATVTGSLNFVDPTTLLSTYPCFPAGYVNVNGQISGNTVILQLIGSDGSSDGQIGIAASLVPNSTGLAQVTFDPTQNGAYLLHSTGQGYQVDTKSCRPAAGGSIGEFGFLCLGLNSTTACQQPITLSPAALVFSPQSLMCTAQNCPPNGLGAPTTQTIVLSNNRPPGAAPLTNLSLNFLPSSNQSDFTTVPNFTESDNCAAFLSSSTAGQSCNIIITFAPQEGCSWAPNTAGVSVAGCPLPLTATLTVTSPVSADNNTSFAVPITGTGISFIQPSVKEIDFGAEALGEAGLPQLLSFTNQSAFPVQILGPRTVPCQYSAAPIPLPVPLINDSQVSGIQVATSVGYFPGPPPTVRYTCDADKTTQLPNFQIHTASDTCTGANLPPQGTCSLEIAFVPQPSYLQSGNGLDYFLELNTLQCNAQSGGASSDCEIDGGRFPVELKASGFSPLRMSPGAGLDFGTVPVGKTSAALSVTLFNDPADPNSATVNFAGKASVSGNYIETDDCPFTLAPGGTCTITVTFKPSGVGFNQGAVSLIYTLGSNMTGNPQLVYLRGTGQ
jgi:hypothetical protein